jgi:hypothetical protein
MTKGIIVADVSENCEGCKFCELAEAVANNGGQIPVCNLDLLDAEWLGED